MKEHAPKPVATSTGDSSIGSKLAENWLGYRPTPIKADPRAGLSSLSPSDPLLIPLPPSPALPHHIMEESNSIRNTKRVFAAIRPPGHHCSDELPSGFCFINNVLVAAAHGTPSFVHVKTDSDDNLIAHIHYKVRRAIILDIDLHHGNGTQSIAWSINSDAIRKEAESHARIAAGLLPSAPGLKVYYGSLHDILSFPCEVRRNSFSIPAEHMLNFLLGRGCHSCSCCFNHSEWCTWPIYRKCSPRTIRIRCGFLRPTVQHLSRTVVRWGP